MLVHARGEMVSHTLSAYSSHIAHSWAHLTTPWPMPTLPPFPLGWTGLSAASDGLSLCQGCPSYGCLCSGWNWEMGAKVSRGSKDRSPRTRDLNNHHAPTKEPLQMTVSYRVTQHKCYIVWPVDRDLKPRIGKVPGVPITYISNHSERIPGDFGAPQF